jgi:hypothetical protein
MAPRTHADPVESPSETIPSISLGYTAGYGFFASASVQTQTGSTVLASIEPMNGLGASHEHLRDEYEKLLTNAFGADKGKWPAASTARFDPAENSVRVRENKAPRLVVLDESVEDQLVPMNQSEKLEATFRSGLGRAAGILPNAMP